MKSRQPIDPTLIGAAVYANSFRTIKPSMAATGLRTAALRYDALRNSLAPRIAEEFLINSRLRRHDVELEISIGSYFTESAAAMLSLLGQEGSLGSQAVSLPPSIPLRMALGEVIQKRRSARMYTGDAMPLAYLATIARAACGITGHTPDKDGIPGLALRSAPSGGGLYPVDLHFAALRVTGLERGIYRYDPRRDALWRTGDQERLEALLGSLAVPDHVITVKQASTLCLLVGRSWRSMRKYGTRGMRHVFLEAGEMAEHINLAAVALGWGSVDCGSFYDDEAHEALQFDGLYEALIHMVILGASG